MRIVCFRSREPVRAAANTPSTYARSLARSKERRAVADLNDRPYRHREEHGNVEQCREDAAAGHGTFGRRDSRRDPANP